MLVKFSIDPATSEASLYTSVPQVCPDLPRRRAKADNVKTHVCASRPLPGVAQYVPEVAAVVVAEHRIIWHSSLVAVHVRS